MLSLEMRCGAGLNSAMMRQWVEAAGDDGHGRPEQVVYSSRKPEREIPNESDRSP